MLEGGLWRGGIIPRRSSFSSSSTLFFFLAVIREESSFFACFFILHLCFLPYFYSFPSCFFLLLLVLRCVGLSSLSCLTPREMEGKGGQGFIWIEMSVFRMGRGVLVFEIILICRP